MLRGLSLAFDIWPKKSQHRDGVQKHFVVGLSIPPLLTSAPFYEVRQSIEFLAVILLRRGSVKQRCMYTRRINRTEGTAQALYAKYSFTSFLISTAQSERAQCPPVLATIQHMSMRQAAHVMASRSGSSAAEAP